MEFGNLQQGITALKSLLNLVVVGGKLGEVYLGKLVSKKKKNHNNNNIKVPLLCYLNSY